jgi:hypothetical protein
MSDFLTNLLTRSFSQETSVRPLLEPIPVPSPLRRAEQIDPVEEFSNSFEEVPSSDNYVAPEKNVLLPRTRGVTKVSPPPVVVEPTIENRESSIPPRESLPTSGAATISPPQANSASKEPPQVTQVPVPLKSSGGISQPERPASTLRAGATVMREPESSSSPVEQNSNPEGTRQRRVSARTHTADATDLRPGHSPSSTVPATRKSGVEKLLSSHTSQLLSRDTAVPHEQGLQIVERFIERTVSPPSASVLPVSPAFDQRQTSTLLTRIVPNTVTIPFPVSTKSRSTKSPSSPPDIVAVDLPVADTVVNVAIGRIEVRATSPAGPKRERQSGGPKVMTLDDYVHQRRGTQ